MTMTDEELTMLKAIIAEPKDNVPRKIYADWLDGHGQSDRAEFIRLQCKLAEWPTNDSNIAAYMATSKSIRKLWKLHRQEWFGRCFEYMLPSVSSVYCGFLRTVVCTWEQWVGRRCHCWGRGRISTEICTYCWGTGRTGGLHHALYWREGDKHPCPPTVQPIRKVDLRSTSWWWHSRRRNDGVEVTSGSARYMCQRVKWGEAHTVLDILKIEWPGVTFEWAAPNPTS